MLLVEVSADQLKQAVETQHGGHAVLNYVAHVRLPLGQGTLWDGPVHVFDLDGHPKATTAYAWPAPMDGGKPRSIAVLHTGGITGHADARITMLAELWMSKR